MSALKKDWEAGDSGHILEHNEISTRLADIRDSGAKGDGKTDDRAAIQTFINQIATAGGGRVYFPSRRWLCDGALTVGATQRNVTLEGDGYSSVIVNAASNTPALILGDPTGVTSGARRATVRNLAFDVVATGTVDQHGIVAGLVSDGYIIERVRVGATGRGCGGHGLYLTSGISYRVAECTIDFCGGDGIHLARVGADGHNAASIVDCTSRQNVGYGLRVATTGVGGGYHLAIVRGNFESNTLAGLRIDEGTLITLDGMHVEANGAVSTINRAFVMVRGIAWGLSGGLTIAGYGVAIVRECMFSAAKPLRFIENSRGIVSDCIVETGGIVDETERVIVNSTIPIIL